MKTIVTILFVLIAGIVFAQTPTPYPIQQSLGNTNTQVTARGALGTRDGLVFTQYYIDTASANLQPYLSGIAGMVIRVNQTDFYVRNEALTAWVQINGTGGGTVTGANNGLILSGANIQLGQAVNQVGDPAAFTVAREIPLNNLALRFRNGAQGSSPDNNLTIDFTQSGAGQGPGVVNLVAQTYGTVGFKYSGMDPGHVRNQVDNVITPALAVAAGIAYNASAVGDSYRLPYSGLLGQQYVGVATNVFCDSCYGMLAQNLAGIKIAAGNAGYIKFYGSVFESGTEYARFVATTGNLGLSTTVANQKLTVNGQVRINSINNASVFDSVVVINDGVLEARLASTLAVNIYNTDGTLTGNRAVDITGKSISFTGSNTNLAIDDVGNVSIVALGALNLASPDVKLLIAPTRSRDTTGFKLLTRDVSTGEVGITDWNAATPPLQTVLDAGSTTNKDNTIANGANTLEITNNTLAGDYGFRISSTSTAASAGSQILFNAELSGANASASEATVAAAISNLHTGSGTNYGITANASGNTTNIAGYFTAVTGTNNYAIIVPAGFGNVGIGTSTPVSVAKLHVVASAGALAIEGVSGSGGVGVYGETSNSSGVQGIHTTSGGIGVLGSATASVTTNTAGEFIAQNGTNNYAIIVPTASGRVGFGTATPATQFHNVGTVRLASLGTATIDTTTYKPLVVDASGNVLPFNSWAQGSGGGAVTWNGITNPTGDQALTFDAGESSTWTNSNTTEDLFTANSSTITTSSFFSLNSTSTALASGNNLAEFIMSGANGSNAITATALRASVTNTNGTSGTNIALDATATGALTDNWAVNATGNIKITSANTTQVTTSAGLNLNASSLTTGTGFYAASSTLSSGKLVDLQVNSTAASSTGQTGLNILLTGANGTASSVTYGLRVSNAHTGTTPVNWSGYFDERVNIGNATNDANHVLVIKSLDNTSTHGIKILSLNETTNMQIGYQTIATAGALVLSPASTGVEVTSNMYVGAASAPTSTLTVGGSFGTAYIAKTGTYTATISDQLIEATTGTFTITLPTAVGISGRQYTITNSGTGVVTIGTTSSQTFVNVVTTPTTLTLNQFGTVTVASNGQNWLRTTSL